MATVAEVVARTLAAYGTEKFFCLMGGDHELWYALEKVGIDIINCRNEASAVYMADAYSRVSGKPGFVYGQRGPGVANVAGAMADPLWASSALISFTSSIGMSSRDRYEYQELDGIRMHEGVTRWNKTVSTPKRAAGMLRAAIRVATGPCPEPVHLEIPAEMYAADAGADEAYREETLGVLNGRRIPPPPGAMRAVIDRLLEAKRPLIVAGKGVVISEAWDELTRFAEALSIPVATSLGGKGAIAEDHDLAVGTIGRNSRRVGNDTVREADMVLAIGTRLGGLATHRWTLPFDQKPLIQIDTSHANLGHNFRCALTVLADARTALQAGLDEIARGGLARGRTAWAKQVAENVAAWRNEAKKMAEERCADGIHPAAVVAAMREVMGPQDIVAADTGAIGSWIGSLFPVQAGKTMVRANGSLGWVLPGILGAQLARPQRRAVALSGDGGLLYHIGELETALRWSIPAIIVVVNNSCLASEYHTQKKHGHVVKQVLDFSDTDFAAVARAFGAFGERVTETKDIKDAIRAALASGKPGIVDVVCSKEAVAPSANNDKTRRV
jgi:acetolactate synthase-1/2/3 large subunit